MPFVLSSAHLLFCFYLNLVVLDLEAYLVVWDGGLYQVQDVFAWEAAPRRRGSLWAAPAPLT